MRLFAATQAPPPPAVPAVPSASPASGVPAESAPPAPDPRVLAAQAGDRKATAALLAELLPRVRNLVRYLVRGDANVDDIAQESLIAIVRGLPSYRAEGHFHSFTDRIVARTALAWLRRERRTKERERESVRKDSMPGGSEAPDQYTLRRQAVARLERLPDEQRQAVVLHHVVGLSVPEVAAQFGVSQETIRSRLRLAQAKLQELARQENGSARPEVES